MLGNSMTNSILIISTLGLALLAGPAGAAEPTLIIKKEAQVRGSEIQLADVAVLEGFDEATASQLGKTSLGLAPRPGQSRYIPREIISARLRTGHPGLADTLLMQGAEGVLVSIKSVLINGQELVYLAKEFLKNQYAELEGDFELEPLRQPGEILIPVGNSLSTFNVQWHNLPVAAGTAALDIQVQVDGTLYLTVPIQMNIRHFARVLVASREIARDETFSLSNTHLMRTEVTRLTSVPARDLEALGTRLARRKIQAGSVLRIADGYLPAIVFRGQPVSVTVKNGSLSINARGIAKQDGSINDMVEVLNANSGRTFKAMVVGENSVEVVL